MISGQLCEYGQAKSRSICLQHPPQSSPACPQCFQCSILLARDLELFLRRDLASLWSGRVSTDSESSARRDPGTWSYPDARPIRPGAEVRTSTFDVRPFPAVHVTSASASASARQDKLPRLGPSTPPSRPCPPLLPLSFVWPTDPFSSTRLEALVVGRRFLYRLFTLPLSSVVRWRRRKQRVGPWCRLLPFGNDKL